MMLDGKVAIVTGASRGIGAGVARELAAQGAQVVLAARTANKGAGPSWGASHDVSVPGTLNEVAQKIERGGGKADIYPADLSDTDQIEGLIKHTAQKYGQIDIVVNAAMGFPSSYKGELWNGPIDDWDVYMGIGLKAKYLMSRFASEVMKEQQSGLIVNISAGASKDNYYNPAFRIAMAGVDRLTTASAADLKPYGVSVVSIWPRWVRTERVMMALADPSLGFEFTDADFAVSDTAEFTGRAIAHLASDDNLLERSGHIFPVLQLAHDYGFTDLDGNRPPLDEHTKLWIEKLRKIHSLLS